jgi:hypothetical protein
MQPNTTLKLTLDFKAEKSLVETGNNKFKLKPVIAVISEEVKPTTTIVTTTSPAVTTTQPITTTQISTTTQVTTTIALEEGTLLMKIKDKMDLTNITSIKITVNKVEVHKAGPSDNDTESNETFETNDTSSAGWETIVNQVKSYNLLDLVNKPGEVMGQKTLSAGKYTQIRLYLSKSELTIGNKTYDVKIPSNRFYWIHPFNIEAGKITTLTLDFDAADSIKETGSNKYMLKPIVKVLSEISATTTTVLATTTTTVPMTTTTTIVNTTTTTIPETTTTIITTTTLENITTTTV